MVADGRPYVASARGPRGRWYRELLAHPRGLLHVAGRRVEILARPAPEVGDRVAAALRAKYAGDPSLTAMLTADVLATTLRLDLVL